MPISVDYYPSLKPVSFTAKRQDNQLLSTALSTQQGLSLLQYDFLLSANDCNIKNYTCNYLTFNQKVESIITPTEIDNPKVLVTNIIDISGNYLTLIPSISSTSLAIITSFNPSTVQNFVLSFDNTQTKCNIWCNDNNTKKFLFVTSTNDTLFTTASSTLFDLVLDEQTKKVNLFCSSSAVNFLWLVSNSNKLSAIVPNTTYLSGINLSLNYQQAVNNASLNTFTLYSSGGNVSNTSLQDIDYNYLMFTPYNTWTPNTSSINAIVDFINLKNYTSKDGYINRVPFIVDKKQRNYNSILTNDYSEKSNESLQLGFNFFTKEYLFKTDKYTKFVLPDTLYPYDKININDAGLKESGSYGANSPYFSDKVYKIQDSNTNVNNVSENNGILLCSWLSIKDGIWYDRYYNPKHTTYITALTSGFTQPLTYVSELDNFNNNNTVESFYDIQSSLMFEPSGTYYYSRIGDKYISSVLSGKDTNLVKENINIKSISTRSEITNQQTCTLDGDKFDTIDIGQSVEGRFNVSFKIKTSDFQNAKAYQLIGNNYNVGFAIRKNFYYTPFVILHDTQSVYFYDTGFKLIAKNTYTNIGEIRDVCYVTQTNDIVLRTSQGLYSTDITGQILYKNESIDNNVKNEVKGRWFYGKGNRALFIAGFVSPTPVYVADLQTLTTELSTTVNDSFSSITVSSNGGINIYGGRKGIALTDNICASISANNFIIFTDSQNLTSFTALSTQNFIYDISSYNEELYIQSGNSVKIVDTTRELLSTITLSQSAVSGYKLDFITEDYDVKLLAFSLDQSNNIIVDKISLTDGEILSTYNLNITSINSENIFVNPTGFVFAEQTYKVYENNLCVTLNLPNTFVTQSSARLWSTYTRSWSATSPVAYWAFNYSSINTLNDNSVIDIIPITDAESHISLDLNLLDGIIGVYVNGNLISQVNTPTNLFSIETILKNLIYLGNQNYTNRSITDYISNQQVLAKGFEISDFKIYNISLSDDFIKYLYMKGILVDDIVVDFTCGFRNSTETVANMFKYSIPGTMSNDITIYIKVADLTDESKQIVTTLLTEKIKTQLPATIGNIAFNFDI